LQNIIGMKQPMESTKYNNLFVTGCDSKTEWQLQWFLKRYRKHNSTPIAFCDFGVTTDTRLWALSMFDEVYDLPKQQSSGWFYKPRAIRYAPAKAKVWLDTDIEVLGDLSGIFSLLKPDQLNMCEDKPWIKRRGEMWHNSGTVGVIDTPQILLDWEQQCITKAKQGDQEVLHEMLRGNDILRLKYINTLPQKYNWLRIQLLDGENSPDKLCMHWTGQKGNFEIEKQIYNDQ